MYLSNFTTYNFFGLNQIDFQNLIEKDYFKTFK